MRKEGARPTLRVIVTERKTKTRTVPDDILRDLESRYEGRGIRSGRMLLLKPADARKMAEEAGRFGIGILGPEYWFAPGNEYYPSPDYSYMLDADDFVQRSVHQAKQDIRDALPDGVAWISFVLAIPISDDDERIV